MFTLIIPTHNRHVYLKRILYYYANAPFEIYIVDSSTVPFSSPLYKNNHYFHLPGLSLTQKLVFIFEKVNSTYVAMCADDDFILPGGISNCIHFLKKHPDYSAAIGNCISYRKDTDGNLAFSLIYENDFEYYNDNQDALKRLEIFFSDYRTIFCAVQILDNLRFAFKDSGKVVSNLFLNEYLTAIIPVCAGKIAQIPCFYQVREFTAYSDDKITDNIDIIQNDIKYKEEYNHFLEMQSSKIASLTGLSKILAELALTKILTVLSGKLITDKSNLKVGMEKKLGNLIGRIPYAGKNVVKFYRNIKIRNQLRLVVKTKNDSDELDVIRKVILKFWND